MYYKRPSRLLKNPGLNETLRNSAQRYALQTESEPRKQNK